MTGHVCSVIEYVGLSYWRCGCGRAYRLPYGDTSVRAHRYDAERSPEGQTGQEDALRRGGDPAPPGCRDKALRLPSPGLQFLTTNIINQLFDLAEVPVEKRQAINDEADAFVYELLLRGLSDAS